MSCWHRASSAGKRAKAAIAKAGCLLYKYIANRVLTLAENLALGVKLSEYHTGYRAFSCRVIDTLPLEAKSNDFVFDNDMLAQTVYFGCMIGEISCPTKDFKDVSSINFRGASSTD